MSLQYIDQTKNTHALLLDSKANAQLRLGVHLDVARPVGFNVARCDVFVAFQRLTRIRHAHMKNFGKSL